MVQHLLDPEFKVHFAFAFGVAEIGKWLNLTKVVLYSVCMQHQPPAVHNDYLMGASWSSRLRNTLTTKWLYVLVKTKKIKNKKYFAPQNNFHFASVESDKSGFQNQNQNTCRIQNKYIPLLQSLLKM